MMFEKYSFLAINKNGLKISLNVGVGGWPLEVEGDVLDTCAISKKRTTGLAADDAVALAVQILRAFSPNMLAEQSAPKGDDDMTLATTKVLAGRLKARYFSGVTPAEDPEGLNERHMAWMLERIQGFDSEAKASRWLGYVQMWLVGHYRTTLTKIKAGVRNIKKYGASAPIEFELPPSRSDYIHLCGNDPFK